MCTAHEFLLSISPHLLFIAIDGMICEADGILKY